MAGGSRAAGPQVQSAGPRRFVWAAGGRGGAGRARVRVSGVRASRPPCLSFPVAAGGGGGGEEADAPISAVRPAPSPCFHRPGRGLGPAPRCRSTCGGGRTEGRPGLRGHRAPLGPAWGSRPRSTAVCVTAPPRRCPTHGDEWGPAGTLLAALVAPSRPHAWGRPDAAGMSRHSSATEPRPTRPNPAVLRAKRGGCHGHAAGARPPAGISAPPPAWFSVPPARVTSRAGTAAPSGDVTPWPHATERGGITPPRPAVPLLAPRAVFVPAGPWRGHRGHLAWPPRPPAVGTVAAVHGGAPGAAVPGAGSGTRHGGTRHGGTGPWVSCWLSEVCGHTWVQQSMGARRAIGCWGRGQAVWAWPLVGAVAVALALVLLLLTSNPLISLSTQRFPLHPCPPSVSPSLCLSLTPFNPFLLPFP